MAEIKATSEETNFVEQINAPILFDAVLEMQTVYKPNPIEKRKAVSTS